MNQFYHCEKTQPLSSTANELGLVD